MRTVAATPDLIPFLLDRMGPARVAALHRFCGGDPVPAITGNIEASFPTWCGLDDSGVVTMGGVMPILAEPGSGYVWQYVADVAGHKRAYVLQGRAMMAMGLAHYHRLVTIIEPEYPAALRHVRRFGFTVYPPTDFNGHLGCLCERIRS